MKEDVQLLVTHVLLLAAFGVAGMGYPSVGVVILGIAISLASIMDYKRSIPTKGIRKPTAPNDGIETI